MERVYVHKRFFFLFTSLYSTLFCLFFSCVFSSVFVFILIFFFFCIYQRRIDFDFVNLNLLCAYAWLMAHGSMVWHDMASTADEKKKKNPPLTYNHQQYLHR